MILRKIKSPPKTASCILKFLINGSVSYGAAGDFYEQYLYILKKHGRFVAFIWYWQQAIQLLPSFIFNSIFWSITMLASYLKIAYRNIKKQIGFSVINILGLAIGIACTILIVQWVRDELSYDRFHKNADELYAATFSNGSKTTPSALAGYIKTEYPEVSNTSRYAGLGRRLIKYKNTKTMESGGVMTDPGFLEMFTVNFLKGDPETALKKPRSIVISKSLAEKYFGSEEAVGKIMNFQVRYDLTVTGVFEDYPANSHLQFSYILPLEISKEWKRNLNTWEYNNIRTYVLLNKNTDPSQVDKKISNVVEKHRPQDKRPLSLQPITRLHLYNFNSSGGRITYVYVFSALAFFILFIACINFINLTTARSSARAKEVGMRKAVGARRSDLIRQFFSESILLTGISLILGICFVVLLLPVFNSITGKNFSVEFLLKTSSLIALSGITVLTGILAGSYPALFLSRFHPVKVLRGAAGTGTKGAPFRKVLVVIQFSLSIFLILGTFIIYNQLNFIINRDMGFDNKNVFYTNISGRFLNNYETIKSEMLQNPGIQSVTLTNIAPYRWNTNAGFGDVHWEGKKDRKVKMVMNSVDYDYLKTFGLKISEGRFFSKQYSADAAEAYVINEAAVRAMGMDAPVGKNLRIWDMKGKIIGVVKDYNFESLHNRIIPMAMKIIPSWYSNVCIKINSGNIPAALSFLENKFKKIYPEYPFEYSFLDDTIRMRYSTEQAIGKLISYFTYLAIFISCLGLFGLASFTAEQRKKEIGIRKVLGAQVSGLVLLLSREFIKWVLLANIVAWPAAWFFMNKWLQEFAYKIDPGISIFILSGITAILIALLTVSYQAVKAAYGNPADTLKYE